MLLACVARGKGSPEVACVTAVATEMDVSPEKQQRAPRSMPQDDLRRVAARQQRFMTQMLGKEGMKVQLSLLP